MLCALCRSFNLCNHGEETHVYVFAHHASAANLVESAQAGCELCCALRELLDDESLGLHYDHRYKTMNKVLSASTPISHCKYERHHGGDDAFAEPNLDILSDLCEDFDRREQDGASAVLKHIPKRDIHKPSAPARATEQASIKLETRYDGNSMYLFDPAELKRTGNYMTLVRSNSSRSMRQKPDLNESNKDEAVSSTAALQRSPLSILLAEHTDTELLRSLTVPGFESNALLQRYFSARSAPYDSQQIWLCVKNDYDFTRQNIASGSSLELSIGSISPRYLDYARERKANFCLNGEFFMDVVRLSMQYPELWKYKRRVPISFDTDPMTNWWTDTIFQLCIPSLPEDGLHTATPSIPALPVHSSTASSSGPADNEPPLESEPHPPRWFWRDIGRDSSSSKRFSWARSHYERCILDHSSCCYPRTEKLPTRLLQLYAPDLDARKIRLITTHSEKELIEYQYIALSHCWGNPTEVSKLISDNAQDSIRGMPLRSLLAGVSVSSLSQNFQDAVAITKGLGFQYLWIDALCILQDRDDKTDWEKEAGAVGFYYRGARITISALCSSGSGRGFLHSRVNSHPCGVRLHEDTSLLSLRPTLADARPIMGGRRTWAGVDKAPYVLYSRAWTLQERLFSRRLLHFNNEQMIWDCGEQFLAEGGQFQRSSLKQDGRIFKYSLPLLTPATLLSAWEKEKLLRAWFSIVEQFKMRDLTFATDVFPALASINQEISILTGARNIAGHWWAAELQHVTTESFFIRSLLWRPEGSQEHWESGAPSWSWASLKGGCQFMEMNPAEDVTPDISPSILGYDLDAKLRDEQGGSIKKSILLLEGMVRTYHGASNYWNRIYKPDGNFENSVYQQRTTDTQTGDESKEGDNVYDKHFFDFDIPRVKDYWQRVDPQTNPHCLLYMMTLESEFRSNCTYQCFLLLDSPFGRSEPSGDEGAAKTYCCRRVGRAYTNYTYELPITEEEGWEKVTIWLI